LDISDTESSYLEKPGEKVGRSLREGVSKSTRTTPSSGPFVAVVTRGVFAQQCSFRGRQDTHNLPERTQTHRLQTAFLPLQEQQAGINSGGETVKKRTTK